MKRVIKNRARVGKPWLVVEGDYEPHGRVSRDGITKWRTRLIISEHDTKAKAEMDLGEREP